MLQAKDLQIGDLVRIKDDVEPDAYFLHGDMHPSQPVKVEEILSIGINPDWYDGEINTILPYDAIEPIPLTPEILEKNGFELLTDTWYLQTKVRKHIHIRFMEGYIAIATNNNIIPMGLKYVHELQHALRLCGIEKEIVL